MDVFTGLLVQYFLLVVIRIIIALFCFYRSGFSLSCLIDAV